MNDTAKRLAMLEQAAISLQIKSMSVDQLEAILDVDPVGRYIFSLLTDRELTRLAIGEPRMIAEYNLLYRDYVAPRPTVWPPGEN